MRANGGHRWVTPGGKVWWLPARRDVRQARTVRGKVAPCPTRGAAHMPQRCRVQDYSRWAVPWAADTLRHKTFAFTLHTATGCSVASILCTLSHVGGVTRQLRVRVDSFTSKFTRKGVRFLRLTI